MMNKNEKQINQKKKIKFMSKKIKEMITNKSKLKGALTKLKNKEQKKPIKNTSS